MAENSKIEWTDATWQPITGCSVVSPGCTNCYAMKLAGGRLRHHLSRAGLTQPSKAGPVWNGLVRLNEQWLDQPLRWKRPRRIFVCAHGDLFHEEVPDDWIGQVWRVMRDAHEKHGHLFQVLTKRPERIARALGPHGIGWYAVERPVPCPEPGIWIGTSIEDHARLSRLDALRNTAAAARFLSLEPLLEDLGEIDLTGIDWVIVGGESGPGARPMHPAWVRSIRDQCVAAGVPFFFKQWGEWIEVDGPHCQTVSQKRHPSDSWMQRDGTIERRSSQTDFRFSVYGTSVIRRVGKKRAGRELDGKVWDQMP